MNKRNIKIAVVGGGNVGRVLSVLLSSAGFDVQMVCRDNHKAIKIDNSYAFEVCGDFGRKSYLVPFVTSLDKLTEKKDIIIFATKSFDMLNRVGGCLGHLTPKGSIVTIQNSYSIDKLYSLIPPESSVCMVCDFATFTQNKVTYVRNYNGVTFGVYNKCAINRMHLVEEIFDEIMETHITKDIVGFAMGRNIINGAIALLGGISGLPLKDILNCKKGRRIFCKIIEESYNVCRRFRINVLPYNNQLDYSRFIERSYSGAKYRHRIIRALIRQNGMVRSSAIDDLQRGSQTELRCLLDCILEYGKKSKTSTSTLNFLDGILKSIETGKRRINKNIFTDMILNCN